MRKVLFLVLFFVISTSLFAQYYSNRIVSTAYERGYSVVNPPFKVGSFILENYPGSIPGTSNFWDYQTNGSNLNGLIVRNDTIIVAYPVVDSTDPTGAATRVMYYIVSENGGTTWSEPIAITTLPSRSGYPDAYYYLAAGSPSVVISGRKYNGSNSRGGVFADALLGLGSFNSTYVPVEGRDYFGGYINGNMYGGVFSCPNGTVNDTLFYVKYNMTSNTMGTRVLLATPPVNISANVRYKMAATGENIFVMWYDNTTAAYALRYVTSTNGGTSFGSVQSLQVAYGFGGVVNGDTCSPWFGIDAVYKPNTTQWVAVWSTLFPTATGQTAGYAQGCKILFESPAINGGNPVEVAGRTNMEIISNPALFNSSAALQVGVTPVSHPSIAYSSDGSRICVAFSGFQPGDSLDGFNFNDIYVTYSDNGGLNWATPVNLTNTPTWDELYPVISESGNTPTSFKVKFQATRGPGSQSFTNVVPTYRVYHAYKVFNPANVGVEGISTEIPEKYSLSQNYPNPFNPVTKIRFDVPKVTKITLKVFNIIGQDVATLVNNESVSPGTKEVTFDGAKLNSGVYFYKITSSDGYSETRKMILIK
jgi:hypothetical protein